MTLPRPPYDPELGAFLEAQYAASPEPAAALSPGTLPGVREMLAAVSPSIDHAAELGIDPARVVIAGNSAGGGLAAATTLMARRAVPPAYRRTPAPARAADLSGLPPAYLDVGSAEVFRDEIIDYASRIWAAGRQAELHVWAGGFHGFQMAGETRVARAALAARDSWLARLLAG